MGRIGWLIGRDSSSREKILILFAWQVWRGEPEVPSVWRFLVQEMSKDGEWQGDGTSVINPGQYPVHRLTIMAIDVVFNRLFRKVHKE